MLPIDSPFNVPLPLLLTTTVCAAGLLVPAVAENDRLLGLRVIVGVPPTVNVTEIFCGLFVTPAAVDVTATVAVYVPTAREPVVALSVTVAGAVTWFNDAVSQPDAPAP